MQSNNLTVLANDLLMFNQLETAAMHLDCEDVDVADVAERALQKLAAAIMQKILRMAFETAGAQILAAPWSHVEMLFRNLLENAVKYSSTGGELKIKCSAQAFEVENRCAKIEDWNDEKIIEPFFGPMLRALRKLAATA